MNFIIVLGSSKPEIRRARVVKAVEYYNSLKNPKDTTRDMFATYYNDFAHEKSTSSQEKTRLIFSGKGRSPTGVAEASDMFRIATSELGVSSSVCIIETESQNTRDNFVCSLKVLTDAGWFKPTHYMLKPTFTICTSYFHAPRSLVIGIEILSAYGFVNIIHTGEQVSNEVAEHEKQVLDAYIKNYMLPNMTVHY